MDSKQAGILLIMWICIANGSFTIEPSDGCSANGENIKFECITATSGTVFWKRERTGEYVTVITRNSNNYFPDAYTVDYENSDPERISSNLTVNSMTSEMDGDVYYCEVGGIPSAKATLTEKDLTCSWCDSFDIYQHVTVNGKTPLDENEECSGVDVRGTTLDFEMDLRLNSQQIGASVAITLDDQQIAYAEIPWQCTYPYSPLIIDELDLSAGGSLSITVTIDHPILGGNGPLSPIQNCPIPDPPKVTTIDPADSYIIDEGNDVTVTCAASGGIPDVYEYRFRQFKNSWTSWSSTDAKDYSGLNRDKAGEYKCRSRNDDGDGPTQTFQLVVHYEPVITSISTSTSSSDVGDDYDINEGDDLKLDCEADANPEVSSYRWTNANGGFPEQNKARLEITDIQRGHAGIYTCEATNTMTPTDKAEITGRDTKSVTVNVQYVVEIQRTVPNPPKVGTAEGEQVSLFVEIMAVPNPNLFRWQKLTTKSAVDIPTAGIEIENTAQSSTLTIHNITPDYFGNYTLTATNDHGSASATFVVSPYGRPDPVRDLKLTVTAVSLTVEWDRGWDGGLAQVFRLEYSGRVKEIQDTLQHYTVRLNNEDGIIESTEYIVSLYAENTKGSSPTVKDTITTKALPTIDYGNTGVKVDPDTNMAMITWRVQNPGSLTMIIVKVCEVNTQECNEHEVTDVNQVSTLVVPEGSVYQFSFLIYDGLDLVSSYEDAIRIGGRSDSSDNITIIAVAVVVTILVVLVSIGLTCFIWRRSKNKRESNTNDSDVTERTTTGIINKLRAMRGGHTKQHTTQRDLTTVYERTNPEYVNEHIQPPEYAVLKPVSGTGQQDVIYEEVRVKGRECSPDAVTLDSLLGCGSFHEVYTGTVTKLEGIKPGTSVMVGRSKGGAPIIEQSMFLNEIKALRAVGSHRNIVHILAQCTFHDPVMAVLTLEENGKLRKYLKETKEELSKKPQSTLLGMCADVARGIKYLSDLKPDILHQCLSAENILLNSDIVCKVSGFGFADHILEKEEYERAKGVEQSIPWMAPEQLKHNDHNKKSDVWAFGVLVWEVYSYGELPYDDMVTHEVRQHVLAGLALDKPANIPDRVFDLMKECWKMDGGERPSFSELCHSLKPT